MTQKGYIFLLFNRKYGKLYVGATENLAKRVYEHKCYLTNLYTKKYFIDKLGYYEELKDLETAQKRELEIKRFYRQQKLDMIDNFNPEWNDLYEQIVK